MATGGALPPAISMRPFLPSKDFGESRRFYEALGFRVTPLDEKLARVELDGPHGAFGFLLQDFYVRDFAENLMMHLLVEDLDGWWRHIDALSLPERFGVPRPRPPGMESWGLRVAYVWDPAGVLWHVAAQP